MKTKFLLLMLSTCLISANIAQGILEGYLTDAEFGEPLVGATLVLKSGDTLEVSQKTDFNGYYRFEQLQPGLYQLTGSYTGYTTEQVQAITITSTQTLRLDLALTSSAQLDEIVVTGTRQSQTKQRITGLSIRRPANATGASPPPRRLITPKPSHSPYPAGNESYAKKTENTFRSPGEMPFSTFSIDVDKAAYSNVRRFVQQGQLPPADAVRTEELINYFHYDYPKPQGEHPFAVHTELGPCPWQEGHELLHIGLKGFEINPADAPPANLVFLIDVSGSMGGSKKLPLVKQALALLVEQLRPQDQVAIVTYAGHFDVPLLPTSGSQKTQITEVINALKAGGGTAGGAALQRAYELAEQHFMPKGSNRVILASDGDFNIGISSPEALEAFIVKKRKTGVYLSVLGFGMGNYKDDRLETLANKGNGNYAYIDDLEEAEKVFITEMGGTLYTIAEDVKLQLEFDSNAVEAYRLIGYENRLLNKEDFEDDTKDAGELGAGHTVTALYEIVRKGTSGQPLATIHLRYKLPKRKQSHYLRHEAASQPAPLASTSENFRFAAAVAAYALCLQASPHKGTASYPMALQLAEGASQDDLEGYRKGFAALVQQTDALQNQLTKQTSEK